MPAESAPARDAVPEPAIGYFGKPGSFCHEVTTRMFGADWELRPFEQQVDGFERLKSGELERIVVPFENSIGGAVPETLDQLLLMNGWDRNYRIQEQLDYPVELCLLRRDVRAPLTRVYSHFIPLQVVGGWLRKHHPQAETVVVANTTAAAERAREDVEGAAVGNAAAAEPFGLEVVARRLAAPSINRTRFLVVGPHEESRGWPSGGLVRAMLHFRLLNQPGALADALLVLKRRRINMTQLLSRPVKGRPGEYQFLLEMDVPPGLSEGPFLKAFGKATASVHVLGAYPVRTVTGAGPARSRR